MLEELPIILVRQGRTWKGTEQEFVRQKDLGVDECLAAYVCLFLSRLLVEKVFLLCIDLVLQLSTVNTRER